MYAMGYYKRQILRPQRQAGMCNPRRGLLPQDSLTAHGIYQGYLHTG